MLDANARHCLQMQSQPHGLSQAILINADKGSDTESSRDWGLGGGGGAWAPFLVESAQWLSGVLIEAVAPAWWRRVEVISNG